MQKLLPVVVWAFSLAIALPALALPAGSATIQAYIDHGDDCTADATLGAVVAFLDPTDRWFVTFFADDAAFAVHETWRHRVPSH